MLIGSSKRLAKIGSINFQIEEDSLDKVETFNHLGIKINKHLLCEDHVDQIRSKINEKLGLLGVLNIYCHNMLGSCFTTIDFASIGLW